MPVEYYHNIEEEGVGVSDTLSAFVFLVGFEAFVFLGLYSLGFRLVD